MGEFDRPAAGAVDVMIATPLEEHLVERIAATHERIVELFRDNLHRLVAGEPLHNRIDPDVFY